MEGKTKWNLVLDSKLYYKLKFLCSVCYVSGRMNSPSKRLELIVDDFIDKHKDAVIPQNTSKSTAKWIVTIDTEKRNKFAEICKKVYGKTSMEVIRELLNEWVKEHKDRM